MTEITFNDLPALNAQMNEKLDRIERLLQSNNQPNQVEQPEELLSVQQAAKFLFLSIPTIYGLVQRRQINFCKRKKRLYFLRADCVEYAKLGRHKTVTEISQSTDDFLSKKKAVA